MKKTIRILQLYPRDMNIYGDWGNTLTIKRRLEWHGYEAELLEYNQGDNFPKDLDIIVGGGGQDTGQFKIQEDLLAIGTTLHKLAEDGTPMLVICGLYQLFGSSFTTRDGHILKGIDIFNIETRGTDNRLIGNVVARSQEFGEIVGYENHSGQTYLSDKTQALAAIHKGAGNNSKDGHEGSRYNNVIGSYLHGSLLPKNPRIADWLIEKAVVRKYGEYSPTVIDDRFAERARRVATKRPR
jgi:CobQ-like glutamine amidotransferase family enzyme